MRIFAPLAAPALEGVAHSLEPVTAAAGTSVVREGERGDHYYVVADGELEVTRDGRVINRLRRGDGFGEIALLRDVPRTATVTALADARLYALGREPFLVAVTGHASAAEAAQAVVRERTG